jgi:regulator of protease activity HflC (stomatin/prohibitin superfamily)
MNMQNDATIITSFPEIDYLLALAGWVSAIIFTIYAIVLFYQTWRKYGWKIAFVRLVSFRVIIPLLLTISINLLSQALVFVRPQQVGVVVSFLSSGGVRPQSLRGGLHVIVPFLERAEIYPLYWQTYTMSSKFSEGNKTGNDSIRARTSDGQEVLLDCSLIFRIDADQAVMVHVDWQHRYLHELVRPLTRGYVRTHVSQFTVQEVNSSSRRDLESTLDRLIREELATKGFILDQFLLRDVTFSKEYGDSIENKQVAWEDRLRAEYRAEQLRRLAQGRADAVLIEAQAQADALNLIGEALAQNRDLLTYRYIDKLSPNIRVMLVPSNSPLILPLPELSDIQPITDTDMLTETIVPDLLNSANDAPFSLPSSPTSSLP